MIKEYLKNYNRELAIYKAIQDGYKQSDIAKFLNLSNVAISKIVRVYKQKVKLFNKLRDKGIFWSYSKSVKYENFNKNIFIEHTLKYGDFDNIKELLELFGKRKIKTVWEKSMKGDKRFIKTNYLIARVFLNLDIAIEDLKKVKNDRFEKFKLFAS